MEILFKCMIKVPRHASSKNEKEIYKRKNGQIFIGKDDKTIICQDVIRKHLFFERIKQRLDKPILCDINAKFTFHFPETVYFTKRGPRSQNLPDLSNLYELPQDCLQYNFCKFKKGHPMFEELKIIGNDSQICSHDGSRRVPIKGTEYFLEIEITRF